MLLLVKPQELFSLLGLTKESLDEYPSLKILVASVYAAFESFTERKFELDLRTETVWVAQHLVDLEALPVISVTSVLTPDGTEVVTSTAVEPHGLRLPVRCTGWVTVTYSGGFEVAPDPLHRAALLQIAHEWARKDTIGATHTATDGGSVSWPELALLKEVERLLAPFVHPSKFA